MKHLFTEASIGNLTLRNRIVMAPMCMYSATEDGHATQWHFTHYESRSIGGVGLIVVEATAVESRGRISGNDLGIWSDQHLKGLGEIVSRIHAHGAKAAIQLAHAGRKCTVENETPIAPSALNFNPEDSAYKTPVEMTHDDIMEVVNAFKIAASRANQAGFDAIEIHGAHGYLINSFLSPLTNKRKDNYGYHNRFGTLFLRQIIEAIHDVWPNNSPIFLRVSAMDYDTFGNTPQSISNALNHLKDLKIDVIHVSSGGVLPVSVPSFDGYQIAFASEIKTATGYPVIAGGRIKHPQMADEIIRNNRADFVFLGRSLLIDPYWPLKAADALSVEINYTPTQYKRWK